MTTTTPDPGLVFNETSTYIATRCPDYCNLPPMHPVDNYGGAAGDFRCHNGPSFGEHLAGFAEEYTHSPGTLEVGVELRVERGETDMSPDELRQLSAHALSAAEWLEAQA